MKLSNLLFILTGFIIGQGAMFLVQTYLAFNAQFELIAKIGISLGLLSLAQWIADFGGVYLLSRKVARQENPFSFIKLRFLLTLLFSFTIYICLIIIELESFYKGILYFSPFIAIVWGINITGILDYKCRNKYVGPISGLPWFLSAIYVWLHHKNIEPTSLGAAYFFGVLVVVIIQYTQIKKCEYISLLNFKPVHWKKDFKAITSYALAFSMSQMYGRLIPILVQTNINPLVAGYYIYGKSFTNITAMFVSFIRRAEFPSLLNNKKFTLNCIFYRQKLSILLVSAVFLVFVVLFILNYYSIVVLNTQLSESLIIVVVLQAIQIIWLGPSLLGQIFIAKGEMWAYAKIQLLAATLSIFIIYTLIGYFDIYTVFIAELTMYFFQIYLYMNQIKLKKWN